MKKIFKVLAIIALVAVIGFSMACSDGANDNNNENENNGTGNGGTGDGGGNTDLNWNVWRDNSSTATLDYSITDDGVCNVTIGGTPEKYGVDGVWNAWKISAEYAYTGNVSKRYEYKFEAWTQSGTRDLHVKYYYDSDTDISLVDHSVKITTTRTTYTVIGQALPKSGKRYVSFELADRLGTVYLKMLEIKEYNGSSGGDGGQYNDLSGSLTISPDGDVTTFTELTATYSGTETVSYVWSIDASKDGNVVYSVVGTNSNKFTPTEEGSYNVTVSATGYNSIRKWFYVDNSNLSGDVTIINISPGSSYPTHTEFTATYSGSETVTFYWLKDDNVVGTPTTTNPNKFTPTEAGLYYVRVSAPGYNDKGSYTFRILLSSLSGNITISPNSGVFAGAQLTATYSGSETVSLNYQWKKDGSNVGTNSNKYTPTTAGSYTVTISATGYASKTSSDVIVKKGWTAINTGTIFNYVESGMNYNDIEAIAYGNGKFVASGGGGKMAYSIDNGITWTAINTGTIFDYTYNESTHSSTIRAIAYGNGKFVAGGEMGKMAVSTDGTTWTAVADSTFGTNYIKAIAYGNGKFVAVGYYGKMAVSTDGTTWTAVANNTFIALYPILSIAYGNGKFVAGGRDGYGRGKMAYSTDGATWTSVDVSSMFDISINAISYGNGKFVAGSGNKVAYSTDGVNWTAVADSTFGTSYINAIAFGNDTFVAVGSNGKMAYLLDN